MSKVPFYRFEDVDTLNTKLSRHIAKSLQEQITQKGKATLIVSGGNTPKALFTLLCHEDIPWKKVYITLADERWVDPTHEASNERMVRETLLQDKAAHATFIGLKQPMATAHEAEALCHEQMRYLPLPAAVCLLGMGEDGHTASLFPCAKELPSILTEKKVTCKACTPTTAPHERMTLTPKLLGLSKKIILHLVGEKKQTVLRQALKDNDPLHMPIRLFLDNPNMEVFCA